MLSTVLIFLAGFFLIQPETAPRTQVYAVVVGIADYKALTYKTGDLHFADKDAQQVVAFLRSKSGGEVPSSHIRLLTNQQATYANIRQALSLFQQAKAGDRILFYFSGHGLPDSFVAYDFRPASRQNLLTYQDIKAAFRHSQAGTKLCIADACLSGSMTYQQTSRTNLAQTVTRNTGKMNTVAMLLASRSTQNAIETGRLGGGAFTYYFLKGLYGQADLNNDNRVTIRELHQYVSPRVKQLTKGRQAPVFYGRFPDNLALAYR